MLCNFLRKSNPWESVHLGMCKNMSASIHKLYSKQGHGVYDEIQHKFMQIKSPLRVKKSEF